MFASFGPMQRFFSIVPVRGMCFVTYFDIRHAENARRAMHQFLVHGRPISVHFSMPDQKDKESEAQHTGTIFVILRNAPRPVDHRDVGHYFSRFGDILQIRDRKGTTGTEFFVEFFDTRAANVAQRENDHKPLFGGIAEIVFARPSPRDGLPFQELVNHILATNPRALPELGSGPLPPPPGIMPPPHALPHAMPPHAIPPHAAAAAAAAAAAMLHAQPMPPNPLLGGMMPPPPQMSMMPPPPPQLREVSPGPAAALAALYGADVARDPQFATTGGPMRNVDQRRNARAQARWDAPLGPLPGGAMYPPQQQQQQQQQQQHLPFDPTALYGGAFDPVQLQAAMLQQQQQQTPQQSAATPSAATYPPRQQQQMPQTPPHHYGGPTSLYAGAPPSQAYAQSVIPLYQSPMHPSLQHEQYVPQPIGAGRPGSAAAAAAAANNGSGAANNGNILQQMSQLTQLLKRPEALSALLNANK